MLDILGRELKIGDLIITDTSSKNECSLSKSSLCIVTGEQRAFGGNRDFKHGDAYLIENPSPTDLEVKAKLEERYSQFIQSKMKKMESDREKAKQRNSEFKNLVKPVIGDILLNGNGYVLYLGICRYEEDGVVKDGHTYIEISDVVHARYNTRWYEEREKLSDRWLAKINRGESLSVSAVLNYIISNNNRTHLSTNNADIYVSSNKGIIISKSYSRKFTDILYHVDLSDWKVGVNSSLNIFTYKKDRYSSSSIVTRLTNMNK